MTNTNLKSALIVAYRNGNTKTVTKSAAGIDIGVWRDSIVEYSDNFITPIINARLTGTDTTELIKEAHERLHSKFGAPLEINTRREHVEYFAALASKGMRVKEKAEDGTESKRYTLKAISPNSLIMAFESMLGGAAMNLAPTLEADGSVKWREAMSKRAKKRAAKEAAQAEAEANPNAPVNNKPDELPSLDNVPAEVA